MDGEGKGGSLRMVVPLAVCLPCLLPFLLAALTTAGVGAAGSLLSDNARLLATVGAIAAALALVFGLAVSRRPCWRGGDVRSISTKK